MRRKSPISGRTVPPSTSTSTQEPQRLSVFEHVQTSSIPQEFLLPGESETTPLNLSQNDDGPDSVLTASTPSNTSSSKDPRVSIVNRNPVVKRETAAVGEADFGNKHSKAQATEEVEIAETPPASLTHPESQRPRLQTQTSQPDKGPEITENSPVPWIVSHTTHFTPSNQSSGTLVSSQPIDIQSNYSSQVSQGYSQSECITTQRVVPCS